jgi:putative endonuclease
MRAKASSAPIRDLPQRVEPKQHIGDDAPAAMCFTDDHTREDIAMPGSSLPSGMQPVPGTLLKRFAIYIMTNRPRGVLYVGLSSWLQERIRQHRAGLIPGFTQQYNLNRLVYFEYLYSAAAAIAREKRLKRWRREWKIALIEEKNPTWRDLWQEITEP